jgi:hypothetical protein
MAQNYHIQVQYDLANGGLTIDASQRVLVLEGDSPAPSVVWTFENVDELSRQGWSPGITIDGASGGGYTGPFADLCQSPVGVLGAGNSGQQQIFSYRAVLNPPEGGGESPIYSDYARLDNRITTPDSSPSIEVRRVAGTERELELVPQVVNLTAGQTVRWKVVDVIPEEIGSWFPRVVFFSDRQPPENPHPAFGPFTSLERAGETVIGAGNNRVAGAYNYRFEIVSADGTVHFESTPDPTLDNEGDPTGGGGEVEPPVPRSSGPLGSLAPARD